MAIYKVQRIYTDSPQVAGTAGQEAVPGNMAGQQTAVSQQQPMPAQADPGMMAKALQAENLRMQRQIMQNQRLAQQLSSQERQGLFRRQVQQQRLEQLRDSRESRERVQARRLEIEQEKSGGRQGLVKRNTTPLRPIPMK
nr:MAG TPA: hypothetical protein [Caudoviricetes sp.]